MKKDLMDILACPMCRHHPLQLKVDEEDAKGVLEGHIICPKCKADYVISEGIPDLLPKRLWCKTTMTTRPSS
jgi:uncharacterized protein YbaR (Trm112 family)